MEEGGEDKKKTENKKKGETYEKWFDKHSDSEEVEYNENKDKDPRNKAVNRAGEKYGEWFDEHKEKSKDNL